jgi:hypothetical protein
MDLSTSYLVQRIKILLPQHWKMPIQLLIPKTEFTNAEGSVVLAARENCSANILPLSTIPFLIATNAYCCVIHVALL